MCSESVQALAEALTTADTALVAHPRKSQRMTPKPLSELELSNCMFVEQGMEHLANAIARSTSLTKLSLEHSQLSGAEAKHLFSAIKTNALLTDIY